MAGNSFGHIFRLTSFGESHGVAIGGIIDGCPAGLEINQTFIQAELSRRKPGQSNISSPRKEDDAVDFVSGIFEGKTLGTPIAFMIKNADQKSGDYFKLKDVYRPSHADFVYEKKYGIRDHRGGGRSSARETIARVVAGAIAKLYLMQYGVQINAFVKQIGTVKLIGEHTAFDIKMAESNIVRCPDKDIAQQMIAHIEKLRDEGDTCGGIIQCVIENTPIGLGEPVFDKLHAELGKAMLSINAVKGFEIGNGFDSVIYKGSQLNDEFEQKDGKVTTRTNHSGGIQGGISNGMPIYFNVAFKPVASIKKPQTTINNAGEKTEIQIEGRHDPCVVPRAVPIVESMAAMVIMDFFLLQKVNSK
ncbi:MAG: chorismate synthase [Sphingobacteriaceae bacterium]|nr:chorismate synthase [Sphingobacteriaceae bacterium]